MDHKPRFNQGDTEPTGAVVVPAGVSPIVAGVLARMKVAGMSTVEFSESVPDDEEQFAAEINAIGNAGRLIQDTTMETEEMTEDYAVYDVPEVEVEEVHVTSINRAPSSIDGSVGNKVEEVHVTSTNRAPAYTTAFPPESVESGSNGTEPTPVVKRRGPKPGWKKAKDPVLVPVSVPLADVHVVDGETMEVTVQIPEGLARHIRAHQEQFFMEHEVMMPVDVVVRKALRAYFDYFDV